MDETNKKEQPKGYTREDFAKQYQALCEKMGFRVDVVPVLIPTNHGTFEVAQQVRIGELPKE